ncbi:hypothetical protein U1Q18_013695 [Sarracenia purpurea var. burkii]
MAVSPHAFPLRKRRPSAVSFVSPNLSDHRLLQSLLLISQEISSLQPLRWLLRRNSTSIIHKTKLLSLLFEELLRNQATCFSPSAVLCLEELYITLQRVKALIEDCSNGSKVWLLVQSESLANTFHEVNVDLSTLLDIFPVNDVNLTEDVEELILLIRKQCSEAKAIVDPAEDNIRREAKGNAAATIFSLTGVHANRKKLGRKTRVIKGLIDLARDGPSSSKRDALVAILSLAGERETVGKLVEGGVVKMASELMDQLPEEAVTILDVVVKRGGLVAVAAAYRVIKKLAVVLRDGTDRARESAAATLVNVCRKGGSETVAELAAIPGIERVIWEIMGMGGGRARRKAASLLRILRRWGARLDGDAMATGYSSSSALSSTRVVLPA